MTSKNANLQASQRQELGHYEKQDELARQVFGLIQQGFPFVFIKE